MKVLKKNMFVKNQHLTNFWTRGFRFTVRAPQLHNVKHTTFTSTKKKNTSFSHS